MKIFRHFVISFTFSHLAIVLTVCRFSTFLLKNRVGGQPQLRVVPVGIDPQLRGRLVLVLDDDVETVLREGMTVPRQSVEAGYERWMGKGWVVGRVLTRGRRVVVSFLGFLGEGWVFRGIVAVRRGVVIGAGKLLALGLLWMPMVLPT